MFWEFIHVPLVSLNCYYWWIDLRKLLDVYFTFILIIRHKRKTLVIAMKLLQQIPWHREIKKYFVKFLDLIIFSYDYVLLANKKNICVYGIHWNINRTCMWPCPLWWKGNLWKFSLPTTKRRCYIEISYTLARIWSHFSFFRYFIMCFYAKCFACHIFTNSWGYFLSRKGYAALFYSIWNRIYVKISIVKTKNAYINCVYVGVCVCVCVCVSVWL
jgi:hypothetical protein